MPKTSVSKKAYEFTEEHCNMFRKNPNVNPVTGAKISRKSKNGVYSQLEKVCKSRKRIAKSAPLAYSSTSQMIVSEDKCRAFKENPGVNPFTGRAISTSSKNGVYSQLQKICKDIEKHDLAVSTPKAQSTPTQVKLPTPIRTPVKREKLVHVLQKALKPVINRGDTLASRIKFHQIMSKYLTDIEPCVSILNGKLSLYKRSEPGLPVVQFDSRIGSESVYGIAYMNKGHGLGRLLKFSCKMMSGDKIEHEQEIKIYNHMSAYAANALFPHFPMTYQTLLCTSPCLDKLCPHHTKKSYYVVLNELASYDIQTWFKGAYSEKAYESVITQLLFAVYAFHGLGLVHNDCHLGNFLIHKVTPGGFWRYRFEGKDVYVPNAGYLLVMWDPGLAEPYCTKWQDDFRRPIYLMSNMKAIYQGKGMIAPPEKINKQLLQGLMKIFKAHPVQLSKRYFMRAIIEGFENNTLTNNIVVNAANSRGGAPGELLNIKPYFLDATLLCELQLLLSTNNLDLADAVGHDGNTLQNYTLGGLAELAMPRMKMINHATLAEMTEYMADFNSVHKNRKQIDNVWYNDVERFVQYLKSIDPDQIGSWVSDSTITYEPSEDSQSQTQTHSYRTQSYHNNASRTHSVTKSARPKTQTPVQTTFEDFQGAFQDITKSYEFQVLFGSLHLTDNFNMHFIITVPPTMMTTPFDQYVNGARVHRLSLSMFKMATTIEPVMEIALSLDYGKGTWENIPLVICRDYHTLQLHLREMNSPKLFKIRGTHWQLSMQKLLRDFYTVATTPGALREHIANMGNDTAYKKYIKSQGRVAFDLLMSS